MKNRGQSLMEILAVVIILAIFMSFAIPPLTSVIKHLITARQLSQKMASELSGWANLLPAVKPYRYAFAGKSQSYISPSEHISMLAFRPTILTSETHPLRLRDFVLVDGDIANGKVIVSAWNYTDSRPFISSTPISGTPLGTATYPSLPGANISVGSYRFIDTGGVPHPFSALALSMNLSGTQTATVTAVRITTAYTLPYGCIQNASSGAAQLFVGFSQPVQFDMPNIPLAFRVNCFDALGTDMGPATLLTDIPLLPVDIGGDRYYWGISLGYTFTSTSAPVMCRVLLENTDYIISYDGTTPSDFYANLGYGPALEVASQCPP